MYIQSGIGIEISEQCILYAVVKKSTIHLLLLFQLRESRVRKMATLLEISNSSYYPALRDIFTDVVAGSLYLCNHCNEMMSHLS